MGKELLWQSVIRKFSDNNNNLVPEIREMRPKRVRFKHNIKYIFKFQINSFLIIPYDTII
jgi:hypothetical protein